MSVTESKKMNSKKTESPRTEVKTGDSLSDAYKEAPFATIVGLVWGVILVLMFLGSAAMTSLGAFALIPAALLCIFSVITLQTLAALAGVTLGSAICFVILIRFGLRFVGD